MVHRARASHVGSCFSCADLLAVLYADVMNYRPDDPAWPRRDRLVVSKGHAAAAVYAVLAESGFFPVAWLTRFCEDGSCLAGHVHHGVPGVEASTGSLGHGLPIACGMALAAKVDDADHRVFALLSDGECDEGATWEAALFAAHQRLDNLVALVDHNHIQSLGRVEDVLGLAPFADKWRAFGWRVVEVDGHEHAAVRAALRERHPDQPTVVLAHTVKGKGVSFMQDSLLWHYRSPDDGELSLALAEIEATPCG
jgi:transketolase